MTAYEKHLRMIANIINEFDFEKVHKAMKCLGWTWFGVGCPTIDQLRNSARHRLDSAIKGCLADGKPDIEYIVSSGGMKATAYKNDYGQITFIQLEFILTSWESDEDYL
jgi:hypothetical protein